jgi:signal transduction histidine kinase
VLIFNMITLLIAGWILTRWYFLKREIRNVTAQLHNYRTSDSMKKIDVVLLDKDMECLTREVNLLMDIISQERADKRRSEHELKTAIANISHDLRTPLTSILGYLQLMNGQDLSMEERMQYQDIAISRAHRLKRLLNDFFELSVIESVDYELSIQRMNMNDLLEDTLLGYYDAFIEKEMVPSVNISNQALYVMGDESAIKRVIDNLISNSLFHGERMVSISLLRWGGYIRIVVSNDVHMEVDTNLIFDRFYTADQIRAGRGKGLGLSIARSLMEKMGGSISAECVNGELRIGCQWNEIGSA